MDGLKHPAMTKLSQNVVLPEPPQLDEQRLAWLALALSPGLGPKRILDAVKTLDAPSQIFALPLTALEGLRFPAEAAQFIFDGKARQAAEEEWARVSAQGGTLVSYSCPEYPERLKEIYDPPPVLWVRGAASLLARPAIAIVGTRHPTRGEPVNIPAGERGSLGVAASEHQLRAPLDPDSLHRLI